MLAAPVYCRMNPRLVLRAGHKTPVRLERANQGGTGALERNPFASRRTGSRGTVAARSSGRAKSRMSGIWKTREKTSKSKDVYVLFLTDAKDFSSTVLQKEIKVHTVGHTK